MSKKAYRNGLRTLGRLLGLIRGCRGRYWTGILLVIPQNLLFNVMMSVSFVLLLRSAEEGNHALFGEALAVIAAGSLLMFSVVALGDYLFATALARAGGELRKRLFDHIGAMSQSWFDHFHSGDVFSRLTHDIQMTEQAWGWELIRPIMAAVTGIGGGIVMFLLDWRAALAAIGLGALGLWVNSWFVRPIKRESDAVQQALGDLAGQYTDTLAAAPAIKIYDLAQWVMDRFTAAADRILRHDLRRARWAGGQAGANTLIAGLSFGGLLLIGSVFVIRGWMAFSVLIGVIQLSNGIIFMFSSIGNFLTALQASLAGADRLLEVLDTPAEKADAGEPLQPVITGGAIRVRNLYFSYGGEHPVLRGVDMNIRFGETVAIVGSSGSGKSTLLKLLMGYYPSEPGRIQLWGQPLHKLRLADVRQQMAYVPQTNYLFSGTIARNIGYGRPGASREEIEEAARRACCHDFIVEMPQGYDTQVGERGVQLSGGQRQRIAIARAFLKDAPILLLDEATASLDLQSEALVQQALTRLMKGRTVVVVAHRLSTVRNAQYILVLEDGRIVERGSHRELLRARGRYAYYYDLQFAQRDAPGLSDSRVF